MKLHARALQRCTNYLKAQNAQGVAAVLSCQHKMKVLSSQRRISPPMGWLAGKQAADQTLPIITSTAKHKPAAVSIPHMESANIKVKQIYITKTL